MNGNGGKLLIVDDDRDTCAMLSTIMEREHLSTLVAHDSDTALKSICSEEPDVVLMNINMSTMNGMAFLKQVTKTVHDLPVVVTSVRAEIQEAVHFAKSSSGWSTYVNGMQIDYDQFRKKVHQPCDSVRKKAIRKAA